MTRENGAQWFGNPFASDLELRCKDGRIFFIHKPFVTDSSGFLKNVLDDTHGTDGHIDLDEKFSSSRLEPIIRWMYTRETFAIIPSRSISMMHEAKFLLMEEDFLGMLRRTFLDAWKKTRQVELLQCIPEQATAFSVQEFLELLDNCDVSCDTHIRLVFEWCQRCEIAGDDLIVLRKHIGEIVSICTQELLDEVCNQWPKAFDDLVPASSLVERTSKMQKKEQKFCGLCQRCGKKIETQEQADAVPCYMEVTKHSEEVFLSKKRKVCCSRCGQTQDKSHPRCVVRTKADHYFSLAKT